MVTILKDLKNWNKPYIPEQAIHTLSNNNQSLGIGYIVHEANHNKKFVLSIIKFLKEIRWWFRMKKGKIPIKMNLEESINFSSIYVYTLYIMSLCRCHPLLI
jgi:hypothetical protein